MTLDWMDETIGMMMDHARKRSNQGYYNRDGLYVELADSLNQCRNVIGRIELRAEQVRRENEKMPVDPDDIPF